MNRLQMHLKGDPLRGIGYVEVSVTFGNPPLGDAGAWGTQFKKGDDSEAARLWSLAPAESEAVQLLLQGDSDDGEKSQALQLLLDLTAETAMHMLIEWLLNHPDWRVRMRFITALSHPEEHQPMFRSIPNI